MNGYKSHCCLVAAYYRPAGLSSWNFYAFTQVFSVSVLKVSLAQKALIIFAYSINQHFSLEFH